MRLKKKQSYPGGKRRHRKGIKSGGVIAGKQCTALLKRGGQNDQEGENKFKCFPFREEPRKGAGMARRFNCGTYSHQKNGGKFCHQKR